MEKGMVMAMAMAMVMLIAMAILKVKFPYAGKEGTALCQILANR